MAESIWKNIVVSLQMISSKNKFPKIQKWTLFHRKKDCHAKIFNNRSWGSSYFLYRVQLFRLSPTIINLIHSLGHKPFLRKMNLYCCHLLHLATFECISSRTTTFIPSWMNWNSSGHRNKSKAEKVKHFEIVYLADISLKLAYL